MWKAATLYLDSSYIYIVPLCSGTVHIVAYTRSRIYYLLTGEVNIPFGIKRALKSFSVSEIITFAVKLVL